jgi:hypothetical protein
MVTRFMCWPASAASCLPTAVEPVNETFLMIGVRDEVFGDFGRTAEDQVEHVARNAGVEEHADQFDAARRRVLGPLQDHRAAGAERGRDFSHRLIDREIPRREGRDRADRLLGHDLHNALGAARHDAAIGAPSLLGEPVDGVGAVHHLELGFDQRLALLQREDLGDGVGALAQKVGGLAHHLGAVIGRHGPPGLEAALGGLQRLVEVVPARDRQLADRLGGGGVEDRQGLAGRGGAPGAGDVERKGRVHRGLQAAGRSGRDQALRASKRRTLSRRAIAGRGGLRQCLWRKGSVS